MMAGDLEHSGPRDLATAEKLVQSPKSRLNSSLSVRVPAGRDFGGELRRMDRARSFDQTAPVLHNQVIKIREEELLLGNGIGEGVKISPKDRLAIFHLTSQMKDVVFLSSSRPSIPSPLGMNDRTRRPAPVMCRDFHR